MPRAYSDDLRERVVAAMRAGQSCRAVGARFGIAPSTAPSTGVKWVGRVARTGSVRAGKMGGHRRPILEPHRDWLLSEVRACPEITLAMLRELLAGRGVAVSQDTVWRFLKACGFRFKKRRWSPMSATAPTLGAAGSAGSAISTGSIPAA